MESYIKNIRPTIKEGYEILIPGDDELLILSTIGTMLLSNTFPERINYEVAPQTLEQAKKILEKHVKLHDIPFCSKETLEEFCYDKIPLEELEKFVKKLNKHVSYISPYDLPVEFTNDYITSGLNVDYLPVNYDEETYYFSRITMPYLNAPIALPVYNHEITHSQITGKSLTNIQNIEVIPIFLELITALEIDSTTKTYYAEQKFRKVYFRNSLVNLALFQHILEDEWLMKATYHTMSEIKANHLFWLYINSNDTQKQYIFSLIQKTLDEKITVEDMLKELDITYENSANIDLIKRTLSI